MDETTPLLREQNGDDLNDENSAASQQTSSSSRIVTILIWSSIIISALSVLYSLPVYLVVKNSPYYRFIHWGMRDSIEVLLPLVCTPLGQSDSISNARTGLPMRGRQPVRHLQTDRPEQRRMAPCQHHLRSDDRLPSIAQPRC
jgi:hypothetical protein